MYHLAFYQYRVQKPAFVMAGRYIRALANLHICEGIINTEKYKDTGFGATYVPNFRSRVFRERIAYSGKTKPD